MAAVIEEQLPAMQLEDQNLTWNDTNKHVGFKTQIQRLGVIAESFIDGEVPVRTWIGARILFEPYTSITNRVFNNILCRHHPQSKLSLSQKMVEFP